MYVCVRVTCVFVTYNIFVISYYHFVVRLAWCNTYKNNLDYLKNVANIWMAFIFSIIFRQIRSVVEKFAWKIAMQMYSAKWHYDKTMRNKSCYTDVCIYRADVKYTHFPNIIDTIEVIDTTDSPSICALIFRSFVAVLCSSRARLLSVYKNNN